MCTISFTFAAVLQGQQSGGGGKESVISDIVERIRKHMSYVGMGRHGAPEVGHERLPESGRSSSKHSLSKTASKGGFPIPWASRDGVCESQRRREVNKRAISMAQAQKPISDCHQNIDDIDEKLSSNSFVGMYNEPRAPTIHTYMPSRPSRPLNPATDSQITVGIIKTAT